MKTDLLEVVESTSEQMDFADGKYTVINENGKLSALRHGEPWARDLVGDNLVYAMLVDAMALKQQRDNLLGILIRAHDAIEALDGTSIENEQLVDDYRAVIDKTMKESQ